MAFAGRRILVTGGSSGIGLVLAQRLTARGARLALLARGEQGLEDARKSLTPQPLTLTADVGDVVAMRTAVAAAAEQLGGLDAVVAGAGAGAYGPFAEMTADAYERTIRTVLLGVVNTAHAALPRLAHPGGTLVVVGSTAGRVPTPWLAAYAAAKHGVRGFVRSLDVELRAQCSPTRVALVAPGGVDTPFWRRVRTTDRRLPPRLVGVYRPEDVARQIELVLERPRTERSVGALMAVWSFADALAPNLSVATLGRFAGLAWRNRERRSASAEDALAQPAHEACVEGGLRSRTSALVAIRRTIERARQ